MYFISPFGLLHVDSKDFQSITFNFGQNHVRLVLLLIWKRWLRTEAKPHAVQFTKFEMLSLNTIKWHIFFEFSKEQKHHNPNRFNIETTDKTKQKNLIANNTSKSKCIRYDSAKLRKISTLKQIKRRINRSTYKYVHYANVLVYITCHAYILPEAKKSFCSLLIFFVLRKIICCSKRSKMLSKQQCIWLKDKQMDYCH